MAAAPRDWLTVYLKGVCMGAADTVPGVSGGTIALITGIYERLITAITEVDLRVLEHVDDLHTRDGRRALLADLAAMDVPFLLVLGTGVLTAVVALSSVMHVAVDQYPVPTYAFFFGLIAASAVVLYRYVSVRTAGQVAAGVAGFVLAVLVAGTGDGGGLTEPPVALLFVAGAIAITAMILPGVSGAFLLVLLRLYGYMTELPGKTVTAVLDVLRGGPLGTLAGPGVPLATFAAGAFVGLFTVAHVVRWALDSYRRATLTFLVALMVGALRAPAERVAANVGAWTAEQIALVAAPALVGGLLVLGLDFFTDDLEY